jgi:hypothetical protein
MEPLDLDTTKWYVAPARRLVPGHGLRSHGVINIDSIVQTEQGRKDFCYNLKRATKLGPAIFWKVVEESSSASQYDLPMC